MAHTLSIGMVVYYPDLAVLTKGLRHLEVALGDIDAICYVINNAPDPIQVNLLREFIRPFALNIVLINNSINNGYGAGNNLAINVTDAKYHLILNPDVFVSPDALKNALAYMGQHLDVGLLCPNIFNEDGSQQFVHRRHATLFDMFLRSFAPGFVQKLFQRRMDGFLLKNLNWTCEQDIPSPSGCCMLFRTSILKRLAGFDSRYFMYYEDSDLGRRIAALAKVRYLPDFKVTHIWERASRKSWKMKWVMIRSGFIYFRKWGGWF